jgi:hypothetical protein
MQNTITEHVVPTGASALFARMRSGGIAAQLHVDTAVRSLHFAPAKWQALRSG